MRLSFRSKLIVAFTLVLALTAIVPTCQARSKPNVDKHAQKIEKKLARYKSGTYLHVVFSDNKECSGALGMLSDDTFTINNAETNAKETHRYGDVTTVEKGKSEIGQGSVKHRHGRLPVL